MMRRATRLLGLTVVLAAAHALLGAATAFAGPIGMVCTNGPNFTLRATSGDIETPDGNSVLMWSYANDLTGGKFQLPGPVLCVNQGAIVTVTLKNSLSEPVSIVFPGQESVSAAGGSAGSFTRAAPPGGQVTYTFTASQPGTYLYESGTDPSKQVEMGLYGALVVRPAGHPDWAYANSSTRFDPKREYLLLFHEIDPDLHHAVETGGAYDFNALHFRYYTVTGRAFPDTIQDNGAPWLPTQPYGSLVRVKPYDATKNALPALIRMVNAGLYNHPFHPHGFHVRVIAQDGRMFLTPSGGDASIEHFGDVVAAGATQDALFKFIDTDKFCAGTACTAAGWAQNPLPVTIPAYRNLTFKDNQTWYSGSPYLGVKGTLPTVVTSYNVCGEFYFPWHSHALNEFVNYDEGFGGLATLLRVDPLPGCTAFAASTKINTGALKSGSYSNLVSPAETPSPTYYQVNSTTTTLRAAMTSLQTTVPATSASGFPASGTYYIQLDSELMQVTGGQGTTTWTVLRHVLGSTAASHSNGAVVSLLPASTDWYASFSGVASGALNLQVSYQGKNCGFTSTTTNCVALPASSPTIPTTLYVWNWRTNAWVQAGSTQPVGSTEASFAGIAVPQSPAGKWSDFVGTGAYAGQMRVRVLTQRASASAGPAFSSWGNFIKIVYDAP